MTTGIGFGIAILAKGPVALLLFTPIAVLTYWLNPTLRPGFIGGWFAATARRKRSATTSCTRA